MAERTRCSIRAPKAGQAFCKQVARLLFADVEPIRRAFEGEPVREVLALVDWALVHEDDLGFEAGRALEAWARRRCRGAYRTQEQAEGTVRPAMGRGRRIETRRDRRRRRKRTQQEPIEEAAKRWQEQQASLVRALTGGDAVDRQTR